jgi:hypothetical protein
LRLRVLVLPLCTLACTTASLNGGPEIGREADGLLNHGVLRAIYPEPEYFAKSGPRLLQRPPICMTPADRRDTRKPRPAFVTLAEAG